MCREVIEDTLFHDKPFSQRRHVVETVLVVFGAMAGESLDRVRSDY